MMKHLVSRIVRFTAAAVPVLWTFVLLWAVLVPDDARRSR